MSEHDPILRHADPNEGYDRSEPAAGAVWAMAIVSTVVILVTIFALNRYFDQIWESAVQDKVLTVPSGQLQTVRGRDDWDLNHPSYLDKAKGQVRIPVATARELLLKEVAAGKLFYPGKPTLPKKDEGDDSKGGAAKAGDAKSDTKSGDAKK